MKASFGSRRQARKVGQDENEEDDGDAHLELGSEEKGTFHRYTSLEPESDLCVRMNRLTA